MALLDKNFREKCKPEIHSLERVTEESTGEEDLAVEISESSLARNILSKMSALSCLYTVQLLPRTDSDSLEVVFFDKAEQDQSIFAFFRSG